MITIILTITKYSGSTTRNKAIYSSMLNYMKCLVIISAIVQNRLGLNNY